MKESRRLVVLAAILVVIATIDHVSATGKKPQKPSTETKRLFEIKSNEINFNIPEISSSSRSIIDDLYAILDQLRKTLETLIYGSTSAGRTTTTTPPTTTVGTTVDPLIQDLKNAALIAINEFISENNKSTVISDIYNRDVYPLISNYPLNGTNRLYEIYVPSYRSRVGICRTFVTLANNWINFNYYYAYAIASLFVSFSKYSIEPAGLSIIADLNNTINSNNNEICKIRQLTDLLIQYTRFLKNNRIIIEFEVNANRNFTVNQNSFDSIIKFVLFFCPEPTTTTPPPTETYTFYFPYTIIYPTDFPTSSEFNTDFTTDTTIIYTTELITTTTPEPTTTLDPISDFNDAVNTANMSLSILENYTIESNNLFNYYQVNKNQALQDYDVFNNEINQYSSNAIIGSICYEFSKLTHIILNHETIQSYAKIDEAFSQFNSYFDIKSIEIDLENAISKNDTCKVRSLIEVINVTSSTYVYIQREYKIYYGNVVKRYNYFHAYQQYGSIDQLVPILKCFCGFNNQTMTNLP